MYLHSYYSHLLVFITLRLFNPLKMLPQLQNYISCRFITLKTALVLLGICSYSILHDDGLFSAGTFLTNGCLTLLLLYDMDVSCHRPFLPGTSLEPAVIPTAQASSFTLQYFPYYV